MEIIVRKEAIQLGYERYYTGKPCKHGHISQRFTKTRICIECNRIQSKDWYNQNTEKVLISLKEYRKNNHKAILIRNKSWQDRNPDKVKIYKKSGIKLIYINVVLHWLKGGLLSFVGHHLGPT